MANTILYTCRKHTKEEKEELIREVRKGIRDGFGSIETHMQVILHEMDEENVSEAAKHTSTLFVYVTPGKSAVENLSLYRCIENRIRDYYGMDEDVNVIMNYHTLECAGTNGGMKISQHKK